MTTTFTSDKRLFDRFSVRYPARIKDSRFDYGEQIGLRDASAWGIRIVSKEKFNLYDTLTLEVSLPDHENPLIIKGDVIWVREHLPNLWAVGVKCRKIDLLAMSRLYELHIDRNARLV